MRILGLLALAFALCAVGASAATVIVNDATPNGWSAALQQGTSATAPTAAYTADAIHLNTSYSDADDLSKIYFGSDILIGTPLTQITSIKMRIYLNARSYAAGQPPMIELMTDSGSTAQARRFWGYPFGKTPDDSWKGSWQEVELCSSTAYWELMNTSSTNYFGNWAWAQGRYAGAKVEDALVGDYQTALSPAPGLDLSNQSGTSFSIKIGAGKALDTRYGAWWQSSAGIDAYIDWVSVTANGVETVYDFGAPVPEPGSMLVLGAGLLGLVPVLRRRK